MKEKIFSKLIVKPLDIWAGGVKNIKLVKIRTFLRLNFSRKR